MILDYARLRKDIPPVLDKIILILLEKEKEKRYQSAHGLIRDLKKIKQGIIDFIPGAEDRVIRLNYRPLFIGRKKEFLKLTESIERAKSGIGSICFNNGKSGIGKTRLAEEYRYKIYQKGGTFIKVKCYSGIKSVPYGLFKEALSYYTNRLFIRYTREEKQGIRNKFKEIFGESIRVILNLCSDVGKVIGDFPQMLKLNPEKEELRLVHVLSLFFLHLARLKDWWFCFSTICNGRMTAVLRY